MDSNSLEETHLDLITDEQLIGREGSDQERHPSTNKQTSPEIMQSYSNNNYIMQQPPPISPLPSQLPPPSPPSPSSSRSMTPLRSLSPLRSMTPLRSPSPPPSLPSSSSEMIDKPNKTAKQKIINAKIEENIIAADEKEAKKKGRFINRKRENFTKGKDSITNSLRSRIASNDYVANKKKKREENRAAKAEVKKDNRNKKIEYQAKRKADITEKVENIESKVKKNIDAKKTSIGRAFSKGRGEIRKKIAKLDTTDRMNTMYILFNKYLLKPLIIIIVVTIVYYAISYLLKLYRMYPRSFVLANYLDISGKYDKSTGLDMELADILSTSLADYLVRPSRILAKIKINSQNMINPSPIVVSTPDNKKSSCSNIKNKACSSDDDDNVLLEDMDMRGDYLNYLKEHLFDNYINNDFYKLLRKFVEHSDGIFNQGYKRYTIKDEKDYNEKNEYDNKYFKKYYDDMKNNPTINTYLVNFFKNIVNTDPTYQVDIDEKIENKTSDDFITIIKEKPDVSYDVQFNKSYESIKNFFNQILTTSSTKLDNKRNILEYYRNLFFRNVLYNIILLNDKDDNDNISRQLGLLESKNILSYIDPEIITNNQILEKYGPMLSMTNDSGEISYLHSIFDAPEIDQSNKLPSEILNNLDTDKNIQNPRDNFKENFEENYQDIKKNIFELLKKYKEDDYSKYYEDYKQALSNVKNYNSENSLINEIYNLSNDKGNYDNFAKKFNINKLEDDNIRVIDIFNHLIIFDYFYKHITTIISDDNTENNYDNCVKYLYYFENFASLKYLNSEINTYVNILSDSNIKEKYELLIGNNNEVDGIKDLLEFTLYQKDKDLINCSIFASLILYQQNNMNITMNDIHSMSKFYFSFVEIKLGTNYIKDVKDYKEHRTNWNIKQNFVMDKIKYLFTEVIVKKYLWSEFDSDKLLNESYPFWNQVSTRLLDRCTWFTTNTEREAMGCKRNENYIEGFGFLKGLLKIPKVFSGFPKLAGELIDLIGKLMQAYLGLYKGILFIFKFKPFLIGFVIFLIKVFIYIIAVCIVIFASFPNLFGLVLGGYAALANPFVGIIICVFTVFLILFGFHTFKLNGEDKTVTFGHTIALIVWTIIVAVITAFKIILVLFIIAALLILYIFILIGDEILGDYRFTQFLYKRLFACENEPLAWYKNSRFDLGNKASRGFFCSLNCGSNYRLSENSAFCERAPSNVPYYCPQPMLYSIYKDEIPSGQKKTISFFINNHPELIYKSIQQQNEFILNYKKNKKEYYEKCSLNNSNEKNTVGKSVCAIGYNNKNEPIDNKIKEICKQTYCSNGNYENFCYKYKDTTLLNDYKIKDNNKLVEYTKNTFALIMVTFVSLYILNELEKNNKNQQNFKLLGKNLNNMKDNFFNIMRTK